MLSKRILACKFRFDTAENEPVKNLQKFAKCASDPGEPSTWARSAARRTTPLPTPCAAATSSSFLSSAAFQARAGIVEF